MRVCMYVDDQERQSEMLSSLVIPSTRDAMSGLNRVVQIFQKTNKAMNEQMSDGPEFFWCDMCFFGMTSVLEGR